MLGGRGAVRVCVRVWGGGCGCVRLWVRMCMSAMAFLDDILLVPADPAPVLRTLASIKGDGFPRVHRAAMLGVAGYQALAQPTCITNYACSCGSDSMPECSFFLLMPTPLEVVRS